MKIVIELNDQDLHKAIAEQVNKQVASLSGEYIIGKVNDILSLKFGRIDAAAVERFVQQAAEKAVKDVTNRSFNDGVVREALASAALKIMKGRAS